MFPKSLKKDEFRIIKVSSFKISNPDSVRVDHEII